MWKKTIFIVYTFPSLIYFEHKIFLNFYFHLQKPFHSKQERYCMDWNIDCSKHHHQSHYTRARYCRHGGCRQGSQDSTNIKYQGQKAEIECRGQSAGIKISGSIYRNQIATSINRNKMSRSVNRNQMSGSINSKGQSPVIECAGSFNRNQM